MQLHKIPTPTEFLEGIQKDLLRWATDYCKILEAVPDYGRQLIEAGATRNFVHNLELYGRGGLHPRLINASGTQYLKLRALSVSEQTRLLEEGVEVLGPDGSTRIIPVDDLTPEQARQAIGKTLAEQRTWLENHRAKKLTSAEVRFRKGLVIFHGFKLPKELLQQWLQEIA